MKALSLLTFALFLAPLLVHGQLNTREIAELRKNTKIPATDTVRNSPSTGLPKSPKLRVFLAVSTPGSDKKWMRERLVEWNRDHGNSDGTVEEVSKPTDADLIFVQYNSMRSKFVESSSARLITRSDAKPGQKSVDLDLNPYEVDSLALPIYSYLMLREDDLWTVLYSDVEASDPNKQIRNPVRRLLGAFEEKMRSR